MACADVKQVEGECFHREIKKPIATHGWPAAKGTIGWLRFNSRMVEVQLNLAKRTREHVSLG